MDDTPLAPPSFFRGRLTAQLAERGYARLARDLDASEPQAWAKCPIVEVGHLLPKSSAEFVLW